MKKIFNILLVSALAVSSVSCMDEVVLVPDIQGDESAIGVYGDQIRVNLNVVVPDPFTVSTRAVDPDGKGVQTMTLFCFDKYGLFISTATALLKPDPNNIENGGIFDAYIPNTTRIMHLVGNQNMTPFKEEVFRQKTEDEVLSILEGSAGMIIYWARVEVPNNVENLYTDVKNAQGETITNRPPADAILDWITIETNPSAQPHRGICGKNHPIIMLRNQARVTVVSDGADDTADLKKWNGTYFEVTGFTVVNTKAFGTVAPYHTDYGFPTYHCSTFTPPFLVDDTGVQNSPINNWRDENFITLPEKKDKLSDISDVSTSEEIFVFETENSSVDPVDIIIKGRNVVDGVPQPELYYKVNITDSEGEMIPVRRNHHYQVKIVGNLNYGVGTFGEALDTPATNNIWLSISDEVKSVMNTSYQLTVDQTKVVVNDEDINGGTTLELGFSVRAISATVPIS